MKKYLVSLFWMVSIAVFPSFSQAQTTSTGSKNNIVIVNPLPQVEAAHANWISSEEGQDVLGTGNYVFTGDFIKLLSPANNEGGSTNVPSLWYYAVYERPEEDGPGDLAAVVISADGKTVFFLGYCCFLYSTVDLETARNFKD